PITAYTENLDKPLIHNNGTHQIISKDTLLDFSENFSPNNISIIVNSPFVLPSTITEEELALVCQIQIP
ncbi:MAG: hypothetical protein LBP53_01145, partial [Candidatus Peribacteria bacterium]|nr:hypothetical protein [Candidatus Peribacteria bacterium]